jgi:hypothetical protein
MQNVELAEAMVKNAKGSDTEPNCGTYFFFTPEDGEEEWLYGIEMYIVSGDADTRYDKKTDMTETHAKSQALQTFVRYHSIWQS